MGLYLSGRRGEGKVCLGIFWPERFCHRGYVTFTKIWQTNRPPIYGKPFSVFPRDKEGFYNNASLSDVLINYPTKVVNSLFS